MALLSLPNELIIQIVEYLQKQRDINAVARVNQRFYTIFNDYLYRENIRLGSSALFWAAKKGRESTARTIVHLGADVNILSQEPRLRSWELPRFSAALHVAAWKGHNAVVKLLLEAGADAETRDHQGWTPLFAALASRHEKIARTICWHIGNAVLGCKVDSADDLTPLHAAAGFGLSKFIRYFVGLGVDVDTRDRKGRTALHHVLLGGEEYRINIDVPLPSANDLFQTVLALLDMGADPELCITATLDYITIEYTARQIGLLNPDERIRALFGGPVVDRSIPLSPNQIGRTWMSSLSPVIRYQTISVTKLLIRRQPAVPKSQSEPFPVLGTARIPELQAPSPNSLWSRSNVETLIAGLSIAGEPKTTTPTPSEPLDPFPQPTTTNQDHPVKTAASGMWANLGRLGPQSRGTAKNVSNDSTSSEKNDQAAKSGKKVRGRGPQKPFAL